MRVAFAFRRADVDTFLTEIDHDQFEEWCAWLSLNPQGWEATNLQTARLSFITAQVNTKKPLRERDFNIKIGSSEHSPEVEKARWEAMSIRQNIMVQQAGKIDG